MVEHQIRLPVDPAVAKVSKHEASEYAALIRDVHEQIVLATGEPKIERKGISLELCATNILRIFKTTVDPVYQATMIYHNIASEQYFFEGNKRTAHCMAKIHLLTSGMHFRPRYKYAVPFIIGIAEKKKTVDETYTWLERNSTRFRPENTLRYMGKVFKEIRTDEPRGRPVKHDRK